MWSTAAMAPDWNDFIQELDRQSGDIAILKRQWSAC
jgi:hypothetical protein